MREGLASSHARASPHSTGTIHASICALVVAQDEAGDAAWAAYAQIFPSPAIQNAVSALLEPAAEEEDKKRNATDPPRPRRRMRSAWVEREHGRHFSSAAPAEVFSHRGGESGRRDGEVVRCFALNLLSEDLA